MTEDDTSTDPDDPSGRTATEAAPEGAAAPPNGAPPPAAEEAPAAVSEEAAAAPAPEAPAAEAAPAPDAEAAPAPDAPAADGAPAPEAPGAEAAPAPDAPAPSPAPAPDAPPAAPPQPRKRPPRPREPLPWPELRAASTASATDLDINDFKELFRALPAEVRDETIDGVREYRKGARRPVSAHAGKSLARAIHTARRARRRPESDEEVSAAIGQALAAEIIASLDVERAAEVILPKRDLLERQARDARRRARDEQDRTRDERRRRAREEDASGAEATAPFGTYSGAKIRGLDELKKLLESNQE